MDPKPVPGFKPPEMIAHANIRLPLYESEQGEVPLLVLHELPGMSNTFIDYCRRMVAKGYKVYMPLMFKAPGTRMRDSAVGFFCLSKEFRTLFCPSGPERHQRPFTSWLRHTAETVAAKHPDQKIGMIGMCLTGGYALAGLAVRGVDAAICCQPSMPFLFNLHTLGMSQSERAAISARAHSLPAPCAKGYRYQGDMISRNAHMDAAKKLLGGHFERYPDLPGNGHSTLTEDTANEAVFQDVLAFLDQRIKARGN